MPTIPSYQSQVNPSADPRVQLNDNAPIEAFGGGSVVREPVRAAQGLLKQSEELFKEQKKKADDAWGMNYYAKAAAKKNELLYSEQFGALGKKGQDALTANSVYGEQYNKYLDELEQGANNDDQRMQAQQIRQRFATEFDSTIQKHAFQESEELKREFAKTAIDAAADDVVLNIQNPGKLSEGIALQESIAYQFLDDKGVEGDLAKYQVHQITSKTYTRALDRMVTMGDTVGANTLYTQLGREGKLTAEDNEAVGKTLKVANLRNESLAASDQIVSKFGTLSAAQNAVREMFPEDAEKQDETMRRVKQRFADRQAAQESDRRDTLEKAFEIGSRNGGSIDSVPPQLIAKLGTKRADLERLLKADMNKDPDPKTYYDLMKMAGNPATRSQFAQMNLLEKRDKLGNKFDDMVQLQTQAGKGASGAKVLDGVLTNQQTMDAMLREVDIGPKTPKAFAFKQALDREVIKYQESTGKVATNEDLRRLGKGLLLEGITSKGVLWNSRARVFELEPGQAFEDVEVPPADRDLITQELQRRGRPVTPEAISKIYIKGQSRGG